MSKFVTPGTVTIDTIKKAQQADSFVKSLKMSKVKTFKQIDGVLFKVSPQRGETRLVLPTNLLDSLIGENTLLLQKTNFGNFQKPVPII